MAQEMKNVYFAPKDVQRILSLHKISETYNEQEVFYKKNCKNFVVLSRKHLCWSLYFNKNASFPSREFHVQSYQKKHQNKVFKFNFKEPRTTPLALFWCLRNTRTRCKVCSNSILKTPERRHWRCSGVFIVNFEHISHLVLVFLLLTLRR